MGAAGHEAARRSFQFRPQWTRNQIGERRDVKKTPGVFDWLVARLQRKKPRLVCAKQSRQVAVGSPDSQVELFGLAWPGCLLLAAASAKAASSGFSELSSPNWQVVPWCITLDPALTLIVQYGF